MRHRFGSAAEFKRRWQVGVRDGPQPWLRRSGIGRKPAGDELRPEPKHLSLPKAGFASTASGSFPLGSENDPKCSVKKVNGPGSAFGMALAILFFVAHAARADFEDGWVAYVSGNYSFAYQEWHILAEGGHGGAQLNIGVLHEKGLGVPKNAEKAMEWFRRAADSGESAAFYNIGVLHRDGRGVPQDLEEAAKWFRESAEHGSAHGRFQLGLATLGGRGIPQNVDDGIELIRKAADDGNPSAAFELGRMRRIGQHLEQDIGEAVRWFETAAASGSEDAAYELGTIYAEGDGVDVDPVRAYAWFWVAVRRGHPLADLARQIVAESMEEKAFATAEELGMELLRGRRHQEARLLLDRGQGPEERSNP